MAHAAQPHFVTPEEYLAAERVAVERSEYWGGEVFAMAGGSPEHDLIGVELLVAVHAALRGKPCRVHSANMKVRSNADGAFVYPDLTVVCGQPEFHDGTHDVIVNPTVVFEVLSPSTEVYDRTKKADAYLAIPKLAAYVLVAQDRPHVEVMVSAGPDRYITEHFNGLDAVVPVPGIDIELALKDLYARIDFTAPETPTETPS